MNWKEEWVGKEIGTKRERVKRASIALCWRGVRNCFGLWRLNTAVS